MSRARFWVAIVVFVAALTHLVATVERVRSPWLGLVSLVLLVGTLTTVVLYFKSAQDA